MFAKQSSRGNSARRVGPDSSQRARSGVAQLRTSTSSGSLHLAASGTQTRPKTGILMNARSSTSLNTAGARPTQPWYLVRGQRDMTDRMISSKRERDAHRQKVNEETSQYFKRLDAQSSLFNKWESDKTMLRYPQRATRSLACLTDPSLYSDDIDRHSEVRIPPRGGPSARRERRHFPERSEDSFSKSKHKFKSSSILTHEDHHHHQYHSEHDTANIPFHSSPLPTTKTSKSDLNYECLTPPEEDHPSPPTVKRNIKLLGKNQNRLTNGYHHSHHSKAQNHKTKGNLDSDNLATLDRLVELMDRLIDIREETKQSKRASRCFLKYYDQISSARSELIERETADWTWREKKIPYMHFARDKLRAKAFIACDQLLHARSILRLLDTVVLEGLAAENGGLNVLSREEYQQFAEVNQCAAKLLDTYLQINQHRNFRYQLLFHEEAENCWQEMVEEWARESQLWRSMIDQLFDTYLTLIAGKLSENIQNQESQTKQRDGIINELASLQNQTKYLGAKMKASLGIGNVLDLL